MLLISRSRSRISSAAALCAAHHHIPFTPQAIFCSEPQKNCMRTYRQLPCIHAAGRAQKRSISLTLCAHRQHQSACLCFYLLSLHCV